MSYKGSSYSRISNQSANFVKDDALYVDKNSVVHYNGEPKLAEEYEERVLLGFQTLSETEKKGYAAKLKNALFGRAWTLCHLKSEISAAKLMTMSQAEESANNGPTAAVKLVVQTVRKACERVAPLLKNAAFEDFFFERGRRKQGEPIQDFIQRRQNEYERMTSLSQGHTKLSMDLQAFFLLRNSGASTTQQRAILGQAGNEYDWDKICEAMMIQLDGDHTGWSKGSGKKGYGNPSSSRNWAFPVDEAETYFEEESYAYDAGDEVTTEGGEVWMADENQADEDDGILEDIEEFEHSLEVLVIDSMSTEELDIFAVEGQKLARSASHYAQKRRMVQQGKTNRGFKPSALQHNRTAVSLDGKLTLNSGQLQESLSQVKQRTKCHACWQYGHWIGDKECPKGGGKGGKGKTTKGRRGGFLQRAGIAAAAAMIITGVTGAPAPMPEVQDTPTDVFMLEIPSSVHVFATNRTGNDIVPHGFAVIDTAALLGCAGDAALDSFMSKFGVNDVRLAETRMFRGVNSEAPIVSKEVQQLPIGLAGREARVSLHRLRGSRVPILLGLPQLRALGAILNLEDEAGPSVVFARVSGDSLPLRYSSRGHLMINIANWGRSVKRKQTISTKDIEVFPIVSAETSQVERRILRNKERRRVQKMADEAKAHGRALWQVLRGKQRSREKISVKELYSGRGGGSVTAAAKSLGLAVGRPRDLLLGDNFLNASEQREVMDEIETEDPFLVVIAFPCKEWSSLSNFKNKDLREWEH